MAHPLWGHRPSEHGCRRHPRRLHRPRYAPRHGRTTASAPEAEDTPESPLGHALAEHLLGLPGRPRATSELRVFQVTAIGVAAGACPSQGAAGEPLDLPTGVGLQPVVVAAQCCQVLFDRGSGGPGDQVVEVAVDGGPAAPGEAAVAVAGLDPAGEADTWPITDAGCGAVQVDAGDASAQLVGVGRGQRAVSSQVGAGGGDQYLDRDRLCGCDAGEPFDECVGAGGVDATLMVGDCGLEAVEAGLGFPCEVERSRGLVRGRGSTLRPLHSRGTGPGTRPSR